jgi:hypothetical protein
MRLKHLWPLLGFALPTLAMGLGVVLPRNGVLGANEITVGFVSTVLGACVTYLLGVRAALRDDQGPARS